MTDRPYPLLRAMAEVIVRDGGGINRARSFADFSKDLEEVLRPLDPVDLNNLEVWIGSLSEQDRESLAIGEESDMAAVLREAPDTPFAADLLIAFSEL